MIIDKYIMTFIIIINNYYLGIYIIIISFRVDPIYLYSYLNKFL